MKYPVNDIYLSLQGEGALAGTPMVILRLQGCSVGCPFCDTKYTWKIDHTPTDVSFPKIRPSQKYSELSAPEITTHIDAKFHSIRWVLITGGEPAEYKLHELTTALQNSGKKVALETSGTAIGHCACGMDWVTVSPKFHYPAQLEKLDFRAFDYASEIKAVIETKEHLELFSTLLEKIYIHEPDRCIISLQPMSLSKSATALCVKEVLRRGWRLSLQTHRYLELP